MSKYKIWNKTDIIYTPGVDPKLGSGDGSFSPEQFRKCLAPWENVPGAKTVISTGLLNGAITAEFGLLVENAVSMYATYRRMPVAEVSSMLEGLEDQKVLDTLEQWEADMSNPDLSGAPPSAEERIAAALEFQNLMSI